MKNGCTRLVPFVAGQGEAPRDEGFSSLLPPLEMRGEKGDIGSVGGEVGYDLCLNLFTENKTHQIWSGGPKRPPRRAPSTQLTTILFVFTYGPASDKKMPRDISRFYTRTVLP